MNVIVVCSDPDALELRDRAAGLAEHLGVPLVALPAEPGSLVLAVTADRLELREGGTRRSQPVLVDFVTDVTALRREGGGGSGRLIAKAIGYRNKPLVVWDTTAGLGRDSLVMASLGCRVTAVERSPVLSALLADGLRRAASDPKVGAMFQQRMRLIEGDAREMLGRVAEDERPHVVYIDPMFPPRGKSALAKKEMRICRVLVGDDPDAGELLTAAMRAARLRVVVKRWLRVPPLREKPDVVYRGKTIRYDVYFPGLAKPATMNL